jgi:CRISPR/Cas system-associated endoribonuclease Cas2
LAIYIVTYDLNKETKRPDILEDIKTTPWAKLSESSYAIDTTETPQQVFDRLEEHLDDNDNLYVILLSQPYYGRGPQAVNDWLAERPACFVNTFVH